MTTREDIELYVMGEYDGDVSALEGALDGDAALAAVAADEARFELPREIEDPVVSSRTGGDAMMYMALLSEEMTVQQRADYALRFIQPVLSTVEGVGEARVLGSGNFAMRIWLNPTEMAAFGVTAMDVDDAIRRLASPDQNVVEGAYRDIMQAADAAIVPLTGALSDPSPQVRLHSARIMLGILSLDPVTIRGIRPRMPELLPRMLAALIERFSDPDPEVRRTVPLVIQSALGQTDLDALGAYDPNEALLGALSDPNETVRLTAATTIMVLEGTPDMTRAPTMVMLLDATHDESIRVRRTIIAAISNRVENELIATVPSCEGCDRVLPVLMAALNDPDDAIRFQAAPALALLDPATDRLVPLLISAGSRHVSILSPLPRDARAGAA